MVSRTSTMTAAISTSPAMTLTTTQQESGAGTASAVSPSRQTATTAPKDCLLSCRCESPKSLVLLFQSLSQSTKGNNNQPMTIYATAQGLTIHANPNKQWQASMELPVSLFSSYQLEEESDFCIPWKTFMECLSVLTIDANSNAHNATNSSLTLSYYQSTELLRIESESNGVVCTAAIPGLLPPDETAELSTAFGQSEIQARVLCASNLLADSHELDYVPGAQSLSITFNGNDNCLELEATGHASRCTVMIPTPLENSGAANTKHSYPYTAWSQAMKPLELAQETCLSINAHGILAIQHQLVVSDATSDAAFCDFLLLPLTEEEEDDEPSTSQVVTQPEVSQQSQTLQSQSQSQPAASIENPLSQYATHRRRRSAPAETTTATPIANQEEHEPSSSSSSDDDETRSSAPSRPLLFGTVVAGAEDHRHQQPPSRRRSRHKRQRPSLSDDQSVDLLSASSPQQYQQEQDTPTHNHTHRRRPATPPPTQPEEEDRYCSSPELVYGRTD